MTTHFRISSAVVASIDDFVPDPKPFLVAGFFADLGAFFGFEADFTGGRAGLRPRLRLRLREGGIREDESESASCYFIFL